MCSKRKRGKYRAGDALSHLCHCLLAEEAELPWFVSFGSSCSMQLDIPGDKLLVDGKVCCLIMDVVLLVWGSAIPFVEPEWVTKYSVAAVVFSLGCWIRCSACGCFLIPWQDETSIFPGSKGWDSLVPGVPGGWDQLGVMCCAVLWMGSRFCLGRLCQTSAEDWFCSASQLCLACHFCRYLCL